MKKLITVLTVFALSSGAILATEGASFAKGRPSLARHAMIVKKQKNGQKKLAQTGIAGRKARVKIGVRKGMIPNSGSHRPAVNG